MLKVLKEVHYELHNVKLTKEEIIPLYSYCSLLELKLKFKKETIGNDIYYTDIIVEKPIHDGKYNKYGFIQIINNQLHLVHRTKQRTVVENIDCFVKAIFRIKDRAVLDSLYMPLMFL
jgi:predicted RNA-binding protein with EMAP domain